MTAEHDSHAARLERFVAAQAPVYADALEELQTGEKQTHWMWFIFPQVRGLGHSPMAERYGIESLEEARAYLLHPVLGKRLRECFEQVLATEGKSLHAIFGSPDDMKFRSSATLFARAAPNEPLFAVVLQRFAGGHEDERTIALL